MVLSPGAAIPQSYQLKISQPCVQPAPYGTKRCSNANRRGRQ